jgi:cytochrome c oxidase cbb3-type subunit III
MSVGRRLTNRLQSTRAHMTTITRTVSGVAVAWLVLVPFMLAQAPAPAPAPAPPAGGGRQAGPGQGEQGGGPPRPNFPQQQRAAGDPAVIARGKALYGTNCVACHGVDLRGGQLGGPNLLRSQLALSDKAGELIGPVIQNGRPNPAGNAPPMPPFPLPPDDIKAIAEYLHSVLGQAGAQGRPPEADMVPPEKILVGDVAAGQKYFEAKCSTCHTVDDFKGIASRVPDPRALQDMWVSGGGGRGRGGRGRGGRGAGDPSAMARVATVTVTPASGERVEGRLVRIDDFTVTLIQEDGTRRTFTRNGSEPKVEVKDPADAHRKLVPALLDKDMHDVTAYLWTLK